MASGFPNDPEQEDASLASDEEDTTMDVQMMQRAVPRLDSPQVGMKSNGSDDSWENNPDVTKYLNNCRRYQVPVDPSVVIALQTQWQIIQPTKRFCEGAMLPLAGILEHNKHVKKLKLKGAGMHNTRPGAGNGNSNARILHRILAHNDTLDTIDLSNTGLDNDGLGEICKGLEKNSSVTFLNVSRNHLGPRGISMLEAALEKNEGLQNLDVSRNALGFQTISALQKKCTHRRRGCCPVNLNVEGNYVFEEILNSMSHAIGFIMSIIGCILLMSEAAAPDKTPYHFWGCLIFSLSLMMLYLSSTLYHSFFMIPHVNYVFQVGDHIAIYFLIAGSYTPFMMVTLNHVMVAAVLLVLQWVCAIVGSVFSMAADFKVKTTMYVELVFYLAMGLSVVCVWGHVMQNMPWQAVVLLVAGGATYIVGIVFFIAGNVVPIYHTVWHVFVMIASTLHWFAVYLYVVNTHIPGGMQAGLASMTGVNSTEGMTCL